MGHLVLVWMHGSIYAMIQLITIMPIIPLIHRPLKWEWEWEWENLRAVAAQDTRVKKWVPRVTRISRSAPLGYLPRVLAPRMEPTRECIFFVA